MHESIDLELAKPTDYKSVGLGIVDWKSTVVSNLLPFLLFDIFPDHFVGDRAGTDGEITARP